MYGLGCTFKNFILVHIQLCFIKKEEKEKEGEEEEKKKAFSFQSVAMCT